MGGPWAASRGGLPRDVAADARPSWLALILRDANTATSPRTSTINNLFQLLVIRVIIYLRAHLKHPPCHARRELSGLNRQATAM
jgi:hypothetical protein